jgi:hypothetical protein
MASRLQFMAKVSLVQAVGIQSNTWKVELSPKSGQVQRVRFSSMETCPDFSSGSLLFGLGYKLEKLHMPERVRLSFDSQVSWGQVLARWIMADSSPQACEQRKRWSEQLGVKLQHGLGDHREHMLRQYLDDLIDEPVIHGERFRLRAWVRDLQVPAMVWALEQVSPRARSKTFWEDLPQRNIFCSCS